MRATTGGGPPAAALLRLAMAYQVTQALLDLAAGRIHAALTPLGAALPLLREGRLRLLAVTNPTRSHWAALARDFGAKPPD